MSAPLAVKVLVEEAQGLSPDFFQSGQFVVRATLLPLHTGPSEGNNTQAKSVTASGSLSSATDHGNGEAKEKGKEEDKGSVSPRKSKRSHSKPKTTRAAASPPRWNETLEMHCSDQNYKLHFECCRVGEEKEGAAEINLETLVPNTTNDKWLALKSEGGGKHGGALLHTIVSFAPKRRSLSLRKHAPLLSHRTRTPSFEPGALDQYIPKKQLQKLSSTERQQQTAIMEFIETERCYLQDLEVLNRVFYQPIKERNLLDKQELASLFSNVGNIRELSTELMKELEEQKRVQPVISNLGAILGKKDAMFKLYAVYCSAQSDGNQRIEQLKSKHTEFSKFVEDCFSHPDCRLLPFDSFLHAPLQRLVKYPLLLEAILKHTPKTHEDREHLESVLESIMKIVNMVNERTRQVENVQALMKLQEKIQNTRDGNDFVDTQRAIVYQGELIQIVLEGKKRKEKQRHVILFNDQLAICNATYKRSKTQYEVLAKLLLKSLVVEEKTHDDKSAKQKNHSKKQIEEANTFLLKHNEIEASVELRAASQEDKELWITKIEMAAASAEEQKFNFRSTPKAAPSPALEPAATKDSAGKSKKKTKEKKSKIEKKKKRTKDSFVVSAPSDFAARDKTEVLKEVGGNLSGNQPMEEEADVKERRINELLLGTRDKTFSKGKSGPAAATQVHPSAEGEIERTPTPVSTASPSAAPLSKGKGPAGAKGKRQVGGVNYSWQPNPKGKGYIFVRARDPSADDGSGDPAQPSTSGSIVSAEEQERDAEKEAAQKAEAQRQRAEKVRQAVGQGISVLFERLQEHHRALHRQDPPITQAEAITIAKRMRELKKELGIYGIKTPRDLQTPRDAAT